MVKKEDYQAWYIAVIIVTLIFTIVFLNSYRGVDIDKFHEGNFCAIGQDCCDPNLHFDRYQKGGNLLVGINNYKPC